MIIIKIFIYVYLQYVNRKLTHDRVSKIFDYMFVCLFYFYFSILDKFFSMIFIYRKQKIYEIFLRKSFRTFIYTQGGNEI